MPKRSPPHPTTPGLTGQILKENPLPPAPFFMHPSLILGADVRRAGSVSAGYLAVLLCSTRTRCVASLDFRPGFLPLIILISILLLCCTQFELILRPLSDRASNDTLIRPHRSPTPTRRGPPRTPSSSVATDANTEYMLSHDGASSSAWLSYRACRPPVLLRLDLALAMRSHGKCGFLGSPRNVLRTAARPRILRVVLRVA
ncbi:hypothetical protein K438DRAFT_1990116 [Mycena galopus ATCC 62051]|nr:hypothetical protein K438DRAFT_1990116 [Mycena galopus ATCC 62051]